MSGIREGGRCAVGGRTKDEGRGKRDERTEGVRAGRLVEKMNIEHRTSNIECRMGKDEGRRKMDEKGSPPH